MKAVAHRKPALVQNSIAAVVFCHWAVSNWLQSGRDVLFSCVAVMGNKLERLCIDTCCLLLGCKMGTYRTSASKPWLKHRLEQSARWPTSFSHRSAVSQDCMFANAPPNFEHCCDVIDVSWLLQCHCSTYIALSWASQPQ